MKPTNILVIEPGQGPRGVNLPDQSIVTMDTIRAALNCQSVERCDALFGGEFFDLYYDAEAGTSDRPMNESATRMRRHAIIRRHRTQKDKAVVRGRALLVQGKIYG
jgi:hypothetical protein